MSVVSVVPVVSSVLAAFDNAVGPVPAVGLITRRSASCGQVLPQLFVTENSWKASFDPTGTPGAVPGVRYALNMERT